LSGAFLDITERKQLEIQLHCANEQLIRGNKRLRQHNQEVLLLNQMGDRSHTRNILMVYCSQENKQRFGQHRSRNDYI